MDLKFTHRGFKYVEFKDKYGCKCSIQKSSLATDDCIWFGIDDPDPKMLASKTKQGGAGWVKFSIPEYISINTRMYLSVDQVRELLPILQRFIDTGEVIA